MEKINKNKKSIFLFGIVVILTTIFFVGQNFYALSAEPEYNFDEEIFEEYDTEIDARKEKIDQIKEEIEQYNQQIAQKQSEGVTLKNQLAILDNEITKIKLDIKKTQIEIEKLSLEIKRVERQIEQAQNQIDEQKDYLAEYIRITYQNDQRSYLEVLLMNNDFSEFFDQIEYLFQIQNDLQNTLNNVQELQSLLEGSKTEMEGKKLENESLFEELTNQQNDLDERAGAKESILIKTKSSEAEFKNLVRKLQAEQNQINAEISTLERQIREELAKREAFERFKSFGPAKFIWPTPGQYITAYFHDPDYPYRYIFEHPAIDIRAGQGTSIRAAESGYVARAKDAGMGYSYIMIVHNDGFSTVYGHVSKIYVSEDVYVNQGEIIGLSGGAPGTPGAGNLTSGPHLHFEVRLNGIPVNPLEYLP
ncbi:peptidoglycan DD-metalloendopeptidase family protein [Patescibacteria group bacterium]|nr:peptidoglycan DD-metalloendopeptidase family protein [Patescibacteria group bacterium]